MKVRIEHNGVVRIVDIEDVVPGIGEAVQDYVQDQLPNLIKGDVSYTFIAEARWGDTIETDKG
jgi:hypothetical protein